MNRAYNAHDFALHGGWDRESQQMARLIAVAMNTTNQRIDELLDQVEALELAANPVKPIKDAEPKTAEAKK